MSKNNKILLLLYSLVDSQYW